MAWELVQDLAGGGVRDVDETICRARGDPTPIRGPVASDEILLKVMYCTREHFDAAVYWSVWANVPDTEGRVHRVR